MRRRPPPLGSSPRRHQSRRRLRARFHATGDRRLCDASRHRSERGARWRERHRNPNDTFTDSSKWNASFGANLMPRVRGYPTVWVCGGPLVGDGARGSGRVGRVVCDGCRRATADGDVADERDGARDPDLKRRDLPGRRLHRAAAARSRSGGGDRCTRPRCCDRCAYWSAVALESSGEWSGQCDRRVREARVSGWSLQPGWRPVAPKCGGRRPPQGAHQTVESRRGRRSASDQGRPVGWCVPGR